MEKEERTSTDKLAVSGVILAILAISLVFLSMGQGSTPLSASTTDLGTWYNIPNSTTCPNNFGQQNALSPDACELLGSSSYRAPLIMNNVQVSAGFSLQCIAASNAIGTAVLQLQYANYSVTSQVNSSRFVNVINSVVPIDGQGQPCTSNGNPINGNTIFAGAGALPVLPNNGYVFRIVEQGGGGNGDNPRFNNIQVFITSTVFLTLTPFTITIITTAFVYRVATQFNNPSSLGLTVGLSWFATDGITQQQGATSCIIAPATRLCPLTTVNFVPAFAGVPVVLLTLKRGDIGATNLQLANLVLFSVEMVTV